MLVAFLFRTVPPGRCTPSPPRQTFDLPAGDASKTLGRFAEQSGEQILFPVNEVQGVLTRAVTGEYTPLEALQRMVEGTVLIVIQDKGTGALAVRRELPKSRGPPAPPNPAPAASRAPPAPASPRSERSPLTPGETVRLPAFVITSEKDASYLGTKELSTARAGVELSDLPQSVVVLNRVFIDDVNPTLIAKSLLYVGGGQTGTISWSVDRHMIRGFVGEGDYVDGFRTMTDRNADLNLIDHVEIIKGPSGSFIGNTANTVGGVISKISKSPTDYDQGQLTLEVGRWDANRVDLDIGGPVTPNRKLSYRILLLDQNARGYYARTYEKRSALTAMLAYQFGAEASGWIKFEKFDSHYSAYNGIPLDGRTGQMAAVPADTNLSDPAPNNWRTDWYWRAWGQFTTRIGEHFALRLAAFDSADWQRRVESIPAPVQGGQGGVITITPDGPVLTPSYVIAPNYRPGQLIPRTTTAIDPDYQPRREIQNDFLLNFQTGPVAHKLLLGLDGIDQPESTRTYSSGPASTASSSPIDPFAPVLPGTVSVHFDQAPASTTNTSQTFAKVYGLETASLFANRLIAVWGASRNRVEIGRTTVTTNQWTGASGSVMVPTQTLYKNLVQYGLLFKPWPNLSVFTGENQNFSGNGFDSNNRLLPPQGGTQREVGVKSTWYGGRLTANVSYFEVKQENNAVPSYPQTNPISNTLVAGTVSRGFDGDFAASIGGNVDLIASAAIFKARVPLLSPWNQVAQPYDGRAYSSLPVDNVSERNLSLWARYKFGGRAQGLSLGVGVNSLARRAITDNANQEFYGYIPGRILCDAMVQYDRGSVRYQLNIDNVFDRSYVYSSRSNQVIVPGNPANFRLSVIYKFR